MDALTLIKEIASSAGGSFAIVATALAAAFIAAWKVSAALATIKAERGGILASIGKIETQMDSMKVDIFELKGNVNILLGASKIGVIMQSHSPVSLTEKGEQVAGEFNARARVHTNWPAILRHLEQNLHTKNAYDIQQYCMEKVAVLPHLFLTAEDIDAIKTVAYQKGDTFFLYCKILGIIIRDRYLQEKGIAVTEIDEHDPGKLKQRVNHTPEGL